MRVSRGGASLTAVSYVLAAMDLARSLPWFAASVRDIRMLRIEELNDLMPAVQQAAGGTKRPERYLPVVGVPT